MVCCLLMDTALIQLVLLSDSTSFQKPLTLVGLPYQEGVCAFTDELPPTCSLAYNDLGPQGGAALAEGLKGNATLMSLECVRPAPAK